MKLLTTIKKIVIFAVLLFMSMKEGITQGYRWNYEILFGGKFPRIVVIIYTILITPIGLITVIPIFIWKREIIFLQYRLLEKDLEKLDERSKD